MEPHPRSGGEAVAKREGAISKRSGQPKRLLRVAIVRDARIRIMEEPGPFPVAWSDVRKTLQWARSFSAEPRGSGESCGYPSAFSRSEGQTRTLSAVQLHEVVNVSVPLGIGTVGSPG